MKYKKLLAGLLMFGAAAGVMAQDAEADRLILHFKDGSTKVFNLKDADYIDFDAVGAFGAAASLKEGSLSADAFTVMVVPDAKCGSYKVTLAAGAEAAVDKGVFSEAAEIEFTGLEPLTQYTVTVAPSDIYGVAGTETTLTVTTLDMAPSDPKVGDYFYSDGTWSDGGLISIDPDGQNAVWAAVKPAPVAGKTVVGIVFNTDPSRIAEADKEAGFTHGYVIACKNAVDPTKGNFEKYPESIWYARFGIEVSAISVTKVSKTWYSNLSGREETAKILEKFASDPAVDVPMFYYCTTGFPVQAPENTSGWFVPSTGQLWDCIANFCSGEVARNLSSQRTDPYDMTYYFSVNTGEPVLANFMRAFDGVPEADKDPILMNDGNRTPTSVALRSSSRYDTESACHFNLGTDDKGLIEGMAGWFDEEGHARPILAF